MQATQDTKRRLGFIILNEVDLAYMLIKLSLLPGFHKIATRIEENLGLDDENTFYFSLDIFHKLEILCKDKAKNSYNEHFKFLFICLFPKKGVILHS